MQDGIENELGRDIVRVKRPVFSTNHRFAFAEFGVRFDYVPAQGILSHTYPDLARVALAGMADALADDGLLIATFVEGETSPGSGWLYPDIVRFPWECGAGDCQGREPRRPAPRLATSPASLVRRRARRLPRGRGGPPRRCAGGATRAHRGRDPGAVPDGGR